MQLKNLNNNKYVPKEVIFKTKQELQQYLVDSIKKIKKIRFNLKGIILTK